MKRKLMLGMLVFLILFLATNIGNTAVAKEAPQVIMLFVEGMSFSDVEKLGQYPAVDKWISESSAGALSMRTPGARTAPNGYLLMGSGGQALYSAKSGTAYHQAEAFSTRETAGDRARELGMVVGTQEMARPSILFPGIFRLLAENREKPYSPQIGLLGTTLATNGIRVAAYGNGDFDDTRQRHSILFAMDDKGRVPYGDISANSQLASVGYPYGVKTNYPYILQQIRGDRKSGLITAQFSDLSRLYQLAEDMEPDQFVRQYDRVLTDLSRFLNELLEGRKENQLIMLVSPAVNPRATKEKALLSPLVVWKNKEQGLLTSATTRQSGLISGVDILPTTLSWLNIPVPKGAVGHVLRVDHKRDITQLLDQVDRSHHTYATRPTVLYTYVMLQIITLACAALLWLWGRRRAGSELVRVRRGVRLALLALLWFPFLLLAEGLLDWKASGQVVLGVLITIALLAAFILENRSLSDTTLIVSGVTTLAIVLDGWTGAALMRHSYLGYDPVVGARFYGLGNEYEGVLIGSAIMFAASLYQVSSFSCRQAGRWRSIGLPFLTAALFGTVLYYMVAPDLGTDAGGFLAGLVGFFVAFARLQGWQLGKKGLLLLAGGLMIGVAVLIAGSLLTTQPLTHVGRVAQQIVMGDWIEIGKMLERKLAMNVRLIRVSMWSKVFVISLVVLGLMALKNERFFRYLAQSTPFLVKGFAGVIAGSLAGLVLNDSGIVTAATCIIFLVVPALYAALQEPEQKRYST